MIAVDTVNQFETLSKAQYFHDWAYAQKRVYISLQSVYSQITLTDKTYLDMMTDLKFVYVWRLHDWQWSASERKAMAEMNTETKGWTVNKGLTAEGFGLCFEFT